MSDNPYRGYRLPKDIISYAVWFYYRFTVSFRDVEEALATRGVLVSYESMRRWCEKFGHQFAAGLRKRRSRTGDIHDRSLSRETEVSRSGLAPDPPSASHNPAAAFSGFSAMVPAFAEPDIHLRSQA